jgi:hypothetical protein
MSKQPSRVDPRDRPMMSWRARLGVLASRGETSGPRVAEAREAMAFWRFADQLDRAVADGLIDQGLADDAAEVAAQTAAATSSTRCAWPRRPIMGLPAPSWPSWASRHREQGQAAQPLREV